MKEMIEHIAAGHDLTLEQAYQAMDKLMSGEVNAVQTAAFLTALKCKGEAVPEIAGFAKAMRDKSIKVPLNGLRAVDVCGTGGDHSGTFNISTAAAFVVAGAGVPVAKHGNRSVSSSSGSADVLIELGVPVELTPEQSAAALHEVGITFLFAPLYHPAMKHVAPVRRDLGLKTVFNILGPLTNPAGTRLQMIGTYSAASAQKMAAAAEMLDMEKVCFVCNGDRFDEILLHQPTRVFEYSQKSGLAEYSVSAADFGFPQVDLSEVQGGSPQKNAAILEQILSGQVLNGAAYTVLANAAMGLYAAGLSTSLKDCASAATDALKSGRARQKLRSLREFGADRA